MVGANNEIDETKNAGKLMTILMAMAMQWYNAGCITRWITSRLHLKPLDAAIGQVPVPYCPSGRHG
jgi:hypothetical protein